MQLLVYNKDHWFESKTPTEQSILNVKGKYDKRFVKGDFIEPRPNGFWVNSSDEIVRGWNRAAFVVIEITDRTVEQLNQYYEKWIRKFNASITLLDDETGIYEYDLTLTDVSPSGLELFDAVTDSFEKLPSRITLISRNTTSVQLRLTLPSEWDVARKLQKRLQFQSEGKDFIEGLSKEIRKSRYYIDLDAIPNAYKTLLATQGWARGTYAQLRPYLVDKGAV